MSEPLDLLAIGPHPDDVELFCGGTLAEMVRRGHRVGILDLTRGELASNGTPEVRRAEAEAAAEILGVASRDNLELPDGGVSPGDDPAQVRALVQALRRLRPDLLLVPGTTARHPDHAAAGHLVRKATFLSGLRKLDADGEPFRPKNVLTYMMRHRFTPSLLVDVSRAYETKLAAIRAHASQVAPAPDSVDTLIGSTRAVRAIEDRDAHYGSMIGVLAAEPFFSEAALGLVDPVLHFRDNPFGGAHAFEALP